MKPWLRFSVSSPGSLPCHCYLIIIVWKCFLSFEKSKTVFNRSYFFELTFFGGNPWQPFEGSFVPGPGHQTCSKWCIWQKKITSRILYPASHWWASCICQDKMRRPATARSGTRESVDHLLEMVKTSSGILSWHHRILKVNPLPSPCTGDHVRSLFRLFPRTRSRSWRLKKSYVKLSNLPFQVKNDFYQFDRRVRKEPLPNKCHWFEGEAWMCSNSPRA